MCTHSLGFVCTTFEVCKHGKVLVNKPGHVTYFFILLQERFMNWLLCQQSKVHIQGKSLTQFFISHLTFWILNCSMKPLRFLRVGCCVAINKDRIMGLNTNVASHDWLGSHMTTIRCYQGWPCNNIIHRQALPGIKPNGTTIRQPCDCDIVHTLKQVGLDTKLLWWKPLTITTLIYPHLYICV